MTLLNELHTLVSSLSLHIAQSYPSLRITQSVAKAPLPPAAALPAKKTTTSPAPPILATQAAIKEPKLETKTESQINKPRSIEPQPPQPQETKSETKAEPPTQPQHHLLTCLCRPFVKAQDAPLADCIEKLEKLNVPTLAEIEPPKGIDFGYPKVFFVSFFAPKSDEELFIQKVCAACQGRLGQSVHYNLPSLEMAADAMTYASSQTLRAIICAYDQGSKAKMTSWLALFGEELKPHLQESAPLLSKKGLFGVPIYELLVPFQQDAAYKGSLWKALQQVV